MPFTHMVKNIHETGGSSASAFEQHEELAEAGGITFAQEEVRFGTSLSVTHAQHAVPLG